MEADFFTALGQYFLNLKTTDSGQQLLAEAEIRNPWFTRAELEYCLDAWIAALQPEAVAAWLKDLKPAKNPRKVGILMAGNIPMVGLHDLLCVLASGHHAIVKLSTDDQVLMRAVMRFAREYGITQGQNMTETEQLKGVEAAIATGSNNSARYFKQYFGHLPHIIRKNRNSVAFISPNEPESTLQELADDIFHYFGLGCRNVTHLFLPEGFNPRRLFPNFESWAHIINHNKYANNYHYHRAILLMNLDVHLDNGFVLLKEDVKLYSPVGILHYSFYNDEAHAESIINQQREEIQCVVGTAAFCDTLPGNSQRPSLADYADGVNTLEWLQSLS